MKNILTVFLLFIAVNYLFGQCPEIANQKRTAIVFGERDYQYMPALINPLNDATDMSALLKKLGFVVYTYSNTDLTTMSAALDNWFLRIQDYDVALCYYSGHGAEVEGLNYIFPIDASLSTMSDLKYVGYPVNRILERMDQAKVKTNILLLDACRDNPFINKFLRLNFNNNLQPIQKGFSAMTAKGAFIGFAASPGYTASDGEGRNGTYTAAILDNLKIPNLTIDAIFTRVNAQVRKMSDENQIPYKNSSLSDDFCFSVQKDKSIKITDKDKSTSALFAENIKSLLQNVDFNSSISDVLGYEFGKGTPISISYDSLPVAEECKNQTIRYYWQYLSQSKMNQKIYPFLEKENLSNKLSDDSYIVYGFKDNKLIRVSLRLFPLSYDFNNAFYSALGQNIYMYPNRYETSSGNIHFISGASFTDVTSAEIIIANEEGYNVCTHDWWHR